MDSSTTTEQQSQSAADASKQSGMAAVSDRVFSLYTGAVEAMDAAGKKLKEACRARNTAESTAEKDKFEASIKKMLLELDADAAKGPLADLIAAKDALHAISTRSPDPDLVKSVKKRFPDLVFPDKDEIGSADHLALLDRLFTASYAGLKSISLLNLDPDILGYYGLAPRVVEDRVWSPVYDPNLPYSESRYREKPFIDGIRSLSWSPVTKAANDVAYFCLLELARSKTVRSEVSKDLDFLDALASSLVDLFRCRNSLNLFSKPTEKPGNPALFLATASAFLRLFDILARSNTNAWVTHVAAPDRRANGIPRIAQEDEPHYRNNTLLGAIQQFNMQLSANPVAAGDPEIEQLRGDMHLTVLGLANLTWTQLREGLEELGKPENSDDVEKAIEVAKLGESEGLACCDQCGSLAVAGKKLMFCGRCKKVMYCGKECQRSAWPSHKAKCVVGEVKG